MADVIVYTYHSFFISSSVDGHLGYFHVLAIVNSAAVTTLGYLCPFQFWFLQGLCPAAGLLCCMVVLFLVFKGLSILFSTVAVSVYVPSSSVVVPCSSCPLQHLLLVDFFIMAILSGMR